MRSETARPRTASPDADPSGAPDGEPEAVGSAPDGTVPEESAEASTGHGRLFGRSLVYVVVWSLELVIATVASPITVNILSPTQFGALATAIAISQILNIFATLGLDQVVMLRAAEDASGRAGRRLVAAAVLIALTMSTLLLLTAPFWLAALGLVDFHDLVMAVIAWVVPGSILSLSMALLVAQDRLVPFAVVGSLSALGGPAAGVVALLTISADATTYVWATAAVKGVAAVVALIAVLPLPRGVVEFRQTAGALALGLPLAFGYVSDFVLNAGDRLIIQRLLGFEEVGRYQIAYIVGSAALILLVYLNGSWLPRIAEIRDASERRRLAARSRDELYRLVTPVVLGTVLGTPAVLTVIAPERLGLPGLLPVVLLVVLSVFPAVASGATERILITSRRGKTVVFVTLVAALANVGLNFALIPLLGIVGSAAATLLAYCVMAVVQLALLPGRSDWRRPAARVVLPAVAASGLAALSLLLPWNDLSNLLRFVAAVACLPWFFAVLLSARRRLDAPADETPTAEPTAPRGTR